MRALKTFIGMIDFFLFMLANLFHFLPTSRLASELVKSTNGKERGYPHE